MRKSKPTRNPSLDALIAELHELLGPAELELERRAVGGRYPLVLIVGAPRSGTTILLQWLAGSGAFAYPTNLLARLSRAPAVSARIQQLLTDPAFGFDGDLFDLASAPDYRSNLGKTKGALAPNEFFFFWRRFLPIQEPRALGREGVAASDIDGLQAALAALEDVFRKPWAMKGLALQYDIPAFAASIPNAFFLHVVRDTVYNAQSLIEAREGYHGTRQEWYGPRPAEYEILRKRTPEEQVVGQVRCTNRAIRDGLESIDPERWMKVDYESFCADPGKCWGELVAALSRLGHRLPDSHPGPAEFESTNIDRLDATTLDRIRSASVA